MATSTQTLKDMLNQSNPNDLADALKQVQLGDVLTPVEHDTGTISATATITLPGNGALLVQSARVVTSGTAASVGTYLVGDSGSTPALPAGGASAGAGVASSSADGTTITFPNTVTRVVVKYIPRSALALTEAYPPLPTT